MTRLIPALAVLLLVAACNKNSSSKPGLTGKWLQIETYNGTALGGCGCWTTVNEFQAEKIEFKSDGTYQKTPPLISSLAYCPGNYRVVNDSTLTWDMNCTGTLVENTNWFSKEGSILIISYLGPSFNVKRKYKKVNKF